MSMTKALITIAGVAAGAVGATLLANGVIKRREVAGLPTEAVIGAGLFALGLNTDGALRAALLAASAGAIALPAKDYLAPKVASALGLQQAAIAGWPYAVGALPHGGALYALPQGATGAQAHANLAGVAGLA